ncbi:hypothetical protein PUN28_015478 [Cardiocondyla obscurior]|uniref:Uncharacterized protein n=1 Tax=Cardiocondyla obscurior TaxID=286306 RepID=A0AAW2EX45_9HYME
MPGLLRSIRASNRRRRYPARTSGYTGKTPSLRTRAHLYESLSCTRKGPRIICVRAASTRRGTFSRTPERSRFNVCPFTKLQFRMHV